MRNVTAGGAGIVYYLLAYSRTSQLVGGRDLIEIMMKSQRIKSELSVYDRDMRSYRPLNFISYYLCVRSMRSYRPFKQDAPLVRFDPRKPYAVCAAVCGPTTPGTQYTPHGPRSVSREPFRRGRRARPPLTRTQGTPAATRVTHACKAWPRRRDPTSETSRTQNSTILQDHYRLKQTARART